MKQFMLFVLLFSVTLFAGEMKSLKIGDKAPSFALKNYDGKEYKLENLLKENKYTVVMWVSTECPVSNAYNDRYVKLNDMYASKRIGIVGVNSNKAETPEDIAKHAKDKGFKFPILKDDKNKIADLYAAERTPEVFVLDSKGSVVYHGRIDDSKEVSEVKTRDLASALDALLAGKKIANAETKAFGCTIKRLAIE